MHSKEPCKTSLPLALQISYDRKKGEVIVVDKYIGVDIGGTKMLMLAKYEGETFTKKVPTGNKSTKEYLKNEIETFIKGLPFQPEGIGVAIPGLVEQNNRVLVSDVLPGINGMDSSCLKNMAHKVVFINDVKAALVKEAGAVENNTALAVVMVGTGIAAGMKQNGHFINGSKGWSGELGGIPIPTEAGIRTLDELASGAAILKTAKMDADALKQKIKEGDKSACKVVEQAGKFLGIGLATIIQLLNPEKLVIGGGTLQYEGYLESAIRQAEESAFPELWNVCTIEKAQEAQFMVALGARMFAYDS